MVLAVAPVVMVPLLSIPPPLKPAAVTLPGPIVTPVRLKLDDEVTLLMPEPPVLPVTVTLVRLNVPLLAIPPVVPLLIVSVDKEAVWLAATVTGGAPPLMTVPATPIQLWL